MLPASTRTKQATYSRIEASLREKIRAGQWPVGAMLPGRRDLAREYGVSLVTVERAVVRLVADGILRADDRRGTFVVRSEVAPSPPLAVPSSSSAFSDADTLAGDRKPSQSFRQPKSATVGIIASLYLHDQDHLSLNNVWVRLVVQSLERAFSEDGKATRFFNRVPRPGRPAVSLEEAIAAALAQGVDALALIALGADPDEIDRGLGALSAYDVPAVCVTTGELRRPVPHVFYDNRSAGYEAARHLLGRGHRDLLFFAPFTASWVQERWEGVRAAVEHHGLPAGAVRPYPLHPGHWDIEQDPSVLGYEAGRAALAEGALPTAVVSANDGVAFGLLEAAAERGKTAGVDFALVSFDDHPQARDHGLASVRPPMDVMGQEAARLLLRALHGEQANTQVRCRGHLLSRASTYTL